MGRKGVGCEPVRDCDAVIRDIRRRTVRERVRIMDLFQDFDRLQHGESSSWLKHAVHAWYSLCCSADCQKDGI